MFTKIHVVRKLNATDDRNVDRIFTMIQSICSYPVGPLSLTVQLVSEKDIDKDTLVIAVGGDGTMLEAMRVAHKYNATATGVNLGKVGFLTDFVRDHGQLSDNLYDVLHLDTHPIEERIALNVITNFVPILSYRAIFNECVISNVYSDHLIKYHLMIDNVNAGIHTANAVIVGTPTGSTAYTLSAGGGLMLPTLDAMQIVPVAALSLSSRPIIVPGKSIVKIKVETQGDWSLKGDGVNICTHSGSPTIEITQHQNRVKILHSKDWNFFDMLTNKLHWKKG